MSAQFSAFQAFFRHCLHILFAVICLVLVLAFMVLPEVLIPTSAKGETFLQEHQFSKMSSDSNKPFQNWQFHLRFPFTGTNPSAGPLTEQLPSYWPTAFEYLSRFLTIFHELGKTDSLYFLDKK